MIRYKNFYLHECRWVRSLWRPKSRRIRRDMLRSNVVGWYPFCEPHYPAVGSGRFGLTEFQAWLSIWAL
jgi:hypothetical protein